MYVDLARCGRRWKRTYHPHDGKLPKHGGCREKGGRADDKA